MDAMMQTEQDSRDKRICVDSSVDISAVWLLQMWLIFLVTDHV